MSSPIVIHGVSEAPASWKTICGRPPVAEHDLAVVGLQQTGDDPQQRRLAASALAHERDRFAGHDVELDAAQRLELLPLPDPRLQRERLVRGRTCAPRTCRASSSAAPATRGTGVASRVSASDASREHRRAGTRRLPDATARAGARAGPRRTRRRGGRTAARTGNPAGGRAGRAARPAASRADAPGASAASGATRADRRCRDGRAGSARRRTSRSRRPARRTAPRCDRRSAAATPRSWVTNRNDAPVSSHSRRISARICACTVTSSAVVGSSAITSDGLPAIAIAIITRCRSPPDSSCGYARMRRAGSGTPTASSSRCASSAVPATSATWRADAHRRVQRGHRVLEHRAEMARAAAGAAPRRDAGHHVEPGDDRAAADARRRDRRRAARAGTARARSCPSPTRRPGRRSRPGRCRARRRAAPAAPGPAARTSRARRAPTRAVPPAVADAARARRRIRNRAASPPSSPLPPSGPRGGSCRRWGAGGRSR